MSLFQKSILHSLKQDESLIASRWAAFQNIQNNISKTDKEIDALLYALYGLSEDEMAIVEGR